MNKTRTKRGTVSTYVDALYFPQTEPRAGLLGRAKVYYEAKRPMKKAVYIVFLTISHTQSERGVAGSAKFD